MKKLSYFILLLTVAACFVNQTYAKQKTSTLGIGFITDSASNISMQYSFFEFFSRNTLQDKDTAALEPVLTLRRGTTNYYFNGVLSPAGLHANLWHRATLVSSFFIPIERLKGNQLPEKFQNELFAKMSQLIGKPVSKVKLRYVSILTPPKFTPDDKKQAGIKDNLIMNVGRPWLSLKEMNSLELAESVSNYAAPELDIFFFNTGFINDGMKGSAKKVVMPLYKRTTPVYIYNYCGEVVTKRQHYDASAECFNSALLMLENVSAYSKEKEELKFRVLSNMDSVYSKTGQKASAALCRRLADLHWSVINSKVLNRLDDTLKAHATALAGFFGEVEANAYKARSASRNATFTSIVAATTAVASGVNDGLNGYSTTSAQTNQLVDQSTELLDQSYQMQSASLEATRKADEIFNHTFSDVATEFNTHANIDADKPLLAFDFMQILTHRELAAEQKSAVIAFADNIAVLKKPVANYYRNFDDPQKSAAALKEIYSTFKKLEFVIFKTEMSGKGSDVNIIN
jgi:hypothetical protein